MFNKVEKPDPTFITRITTQEALEYWVSLIMEGYFRLIKNQGWTESEAVTEYNNHYHEENNPVMMYLREVGEDLDNLLLGHTMTQVKADYREWSGDDYAPASSKALRQGMWDLYKIGLGSKLVGDKVRRVCMRQSETSQNLKP
jgi:putative DNA primase/helicase